MLIFLVLITQLTKLKSQSRCKCRGSSMIHWWKRGSVKLPLTRTHYPLVAQYRDPLVSQSGLNVLQNGYFRIADP